jgi:hypothetical protein
LATRTSSFFSSCIPCPELCESLFTAISWPSESTPCINVNLQLPKLKTLCEMKWQECHLIDCTETSFAKPISLNKVISCST